MAEIQGSDQNRNGDPGRGPHPDRDLGFMAQK